MTIRDERREAAIERMADHILSEGLGAATLRPLAAAVGTSDRMLLYYFADRDEILAATLERVAARLIARLDEVIPAEPRQAFRPLAAQVWSVLSSEGLRAYMPLWLELASSAARGAQPHRAVAGRMADGFLAWIEARLEPDGGGRPSHSAALLFAALEGIYLLEAIGQGATAAGAMSELIA